MKNYVVTLEVSTPKEVTFCAEDDEAAVQRAYEIASCGAHGFARVDWVHELVGPPDRRPVHHD